MTLQQRERVHGPCQDPQRSRPSYAHRRVVALGGEDLGDPVAHRDQHDHVAGVGPRDQRLQAELVALTGAHELRHRRGRATRFGGVGVRLDDLGLHQGEEGRPRQAGEVRRDLRVHPLGLLPAQVGGPGAPGHLAGLPRPHPALADALPQARVPVLHGQRVGQQVLGGDPAPAQQARQLADRELPDQRRAVGADGLRALGARQDVTVTVSVSEAGLVVQHRPVRHQLELGGLRLDQRRVVGHQRIGCGVAVEPLDRRGVHVPNARRHHRQFSVVRDRPQTVMSSRTSRTTPNNATSAANAGAMNGPWWSGRVWVRQ
jgi:hypothetical protein